LIRLLFPTFGYPTTPTVTLRAVGLYALSRFRSAGAVAEEMFVRWCWDDEVERNGRVGVECRRCLSHNWAFERGIRSVTEWILMLILRSNRTRQFYLTQRQVFSPHTLSSVLPPPQVDSCILRDLEHRGREWRCHFGQSPCGACEGNVCGVVPLFFQLMRKRGKCGLRAKMSLRRGQLATKGWVQMPWWSLDPICGVEGAVCASEIKPVIDRPAHRVRSLFLSIPHFEVR